MLIARASYSRRSRSMKYRSRRHIVCIVAFAFILYALKLSKMAILTNAPSGSSTNTNRQTGALPSTQELIEAIEGEKERAFIATVPLTMWSSDFHISPVSDIKYITSKLSNDVKIIDKSLSGHCHLTNSCARDLRIVNTHNGISLSNCPNKLKRQFYNDYKCDSEFQSVDAFLCTHANSMCELYMPFNTTLIVIVSTRYEIGRHDPQRWIEWNENLKRISLNKNNVIAANNKYDQEYLRYFTGIKDILLLPSYCGYITDRYRPTRSGYLLAPARGVSGKLSAILFDALAEHRAANKGSAAVTITHIRDLYPHYKYADLSAHPGVVLLPYQVSFMSFFELYRMEIPMFAPSPELLAKWHQRYNVLNERTWALVFGMSQGESSIGRHPSAGTSVGKDNQFMQYDPNNDKDYEAILHWIRLSDFYTFPFVVQFTSFDHLFSLLTTTDLSAVSKNMHSYNTNDKDSIYKKWETILRNVQEMRKDKHSAFRSRGGGKCSSSLPDEINEALVATYGVKQSESCVGTLLA